MKHIRQSCAALALVLLMLAGCAPGQAPESGSSSRQPDLLPTAAAALKSADPSAITAGGSGLTGQGAVVRVTSTLLSQVAGLLSGAQAEPVQMDSISGGNVGQFLIQGQTKSGYLSVDLYGCPPDHALYPNRTVVWLQYGDQGGQYLADRSLYDGVMDLARQNLHQNLLTLEGTRTELHFSSSYASIKAEGFTLQGALNLNGVLVCCFYQSDRSVTRLEAVRLSSGQSLYSDEEPGLCRLQTLPVPTVPGYDFALYCPNRVVLRSSADPAKEKSVALPKAMLDLLGQSGSPCDNYSVDLNNGAMAVANDSGLWYGRLSGSAAPRLLVAAADLPALLGDSARQPQFSETVEPSLLLRQARILDGGQVVTAEMIAPGAQSGAIALVTHSLVTGASRCYAGVFSAMMGAADYPSDTTVAALGDYVTLIDLTSGSTTVVQGVPILEMSADYRTFAGIANTQNDQGTTVHQLYVYQPAGANTRSTLLTATGDQFYLMRVVPGYALCACEDSSSSQVIAVPLFS